MKLIAKISSLFLIVISGFAQGQNPDTTLVYKNVNGTALTLHIFFPENHTSKDTKPAMVFFHGGGFKQGSPEHFYGQSRYLADRGMVALSVQYRTENANGTKPMECVKDGKSAIRWIKVNASKFGIDPNNILAGGGSAGGHIAAAMAVLKGFNESGEDTTISCVPKALVLFNPVLNLGPDGYGYEQVGEIYKQFSPYHNVRGKIPPTLIMLGTEDRLFTPAMARQYKTKMQQLGQRCDLILYKGQEHAFFNKDRSEKMYRLTILDMDRFLTSLGYLNAQSSTAKKAKKPNLIIIHTDEHNLRTLGCYRSTMSNEQALMWGKEAVVKTPNIDKLAEGGVLCNNWYATSPVCTPSRASMVTGLYPVATGSYRNDLPLKDEVITFAEILKQNGYATSYVGKWHLDGEAKPGFKPERQFGFDDNRYMWNRGHWKTLGEDENGPKVLDRTHERGWVIFQPELANDKNFTTDFLVDRTIEIIERDKDIPFCLMLSIPDPHGPNNVRKPYSEMYTDMSFKKPVSYQKPERSPLWNVSEKKNKVEDFFNNGIPQYYGMVKCIDNNVGRLMAFLEKNGLTENTIVVFTSDHGDLMGEHGKLNKGLPYEMSARVAFILKYPGKVLPGKQLNKAYTMADFTPTVLGLMGIDHTQTFHGIDASGDFLSNDLELSDDRIVYLTNAFGRWVAAVNKKYKLVMSPKDRPWLFDLEKDPNELINVYNDPEYAEIAKKFKTELFRQMKLYNEPLQIDELFK